MSSDGSNPTAKGSVSTSDAGQTRRRRLPGPESGFGKRLREARGIQTQAEVAERAEIARSAYARYETGNRYPSVPELRRLCDALSVTPEHLIFGTDGPGFTPSPTPLTEISPEGDSEQARASRLVITGVLLSALPTNEADAFRELIWAAASKHLNEQPEALRAITELCRVLTNTVWPDIDQLVEQQFKKDPQIKEIVESLSDDESDNR